MLNRKKSTEARKLMLVCNHYADSNLDTPFLCRRDVFVEIT